MMTKSPKAVRFYGTLK
ncbi:putative teneurin and n-acetylglucosamine-1-phosphodiester alpha-n-acetylglucosaminidase [Schistosoma mansoni]|nr:putative teneurin and n-acetylglucosamine-1-phosphodiester alpha-n-acetylglucosaminidase [Schistosoma mansoni]|eukprot:XP_018647780.1 putative teneurin and n-acetylglucosamine-1-phosphodiester alpha-n-acetylglucosaminidase [Schistosoma mansoni]